MISLRVSETIRFYYKNMLHKKKKFTMSRKIIKLRLKHLYFKDKDFMNVALDSDFNKLYI